MKQIRCNQCGRQIVYGNQPNGSEKPEDYLFVEKEWGFFSKKDLEVHTFCLCENCYDKLIKGFMIPVEVRELEEVL